MPPLVFVIKSNCIFRHDDAAIKKVQNQRQKYKSNNRTVNVIETVDGVKYIQSTEHEDRNPSDDDDVYYEDEHALETIPKEQ